MNDEIKALHDPANVPISLIGVWMVLYLKATGRITQVMMQSPVTAGMLASAETGVCEIPGAGPSMIQALTFADRHFVDTSAFYPQIRQRLPCPAALDGHTLTGLPLPCTITITVQGDEARTYDVVDSASVAIDFDHPGEYTAVVRSERFLPGEYLIKV